MSESIENNDDFVQLILNKRKSPIISKIRLIFDDYGCVQFARLNDEDILDAFVIDLHFSHVEKIDYSNSGKLFTFSLTDMIEGKKSLEGDVFSYSKWNNTKEKPWLRENHYN